MIFKIGLILTIFVTIPAFIIGAFMFLVTERKGSNWDYENEPETTCWNCNHCFKDFGEWRCFCEESIWFDRVIEDLNITDCSDWESDGSGTK